jgi:hypothetical protein
MAKKARTTISVPKLHTVGSILDHINSLPRDERIKLFELLARHPDNTEANAWWYAESMASAFKKASRRAIENEASAEQALSLAEAKFQDAQEDLRNSVPKRKMTPANHETLEQYRRLLKKHGKQRGAQMKALKELVTLPIEQGKKYVLNYRQSCLHDPKSIGDIEAVRQHVKRLRVTYRKRQ